jgi:hypothetical protein
MPLRAILPNVVVEWLTLILRIREGPGSILGPATGYPNSRFSWFSSVPPGELLDSTLKLGLDRFLPTSNSSSFTLIIDDVYTLYWKSVVK